MNIFIHELKSYSKVSVIWITSLVLIIALFMSVYPAFVKDVEDARKLFEGFPQAAREALGIVLENFFSLLGFFAFIYAYVVLGGAIQAMNLGASVISKETRDKTADFLLTKPVDRKTIMTAKLLATLLILVLTNTACIISSYIMLWVVKTDNLDISTFILLALTLFFIQLVFWSLGVLVSLLAKRIKSVLPVSLGTVFAFYSINILESIIDKDLARYITPFKFFDNHYIIKNSSYEAVFLIEALVIAAVSISASYIVYSKKDIHAV